MSLNSIFQYFVPKDKKIFFPLFEQAASNVVTMGTVLVEAVNSNNEATREELFKQIDKLENKGDEITHQVHLELGKNFITPFDREDIHDLISTMDDVVDYIHATSTRIHFYKLPFCKLDMLHYIAITSCLHNEDDIHDRMVILYEVVFHLMYP